MPPKFILDRAEALHAAVSIVSQKGIEGLNARSLAELLGCSTKPLFRIYRNMDQLKLDVFSYINSYCSDFLRNQLDLARDYIGLAIRYVCFAKEEPNFFKTLFMSNAITYTVITNMLMDEDIEQLLNGLSTAYHVDRQEAQSIYQKMWLLSHGLASIIATNSDSFQLEEAEKILSDALKGFIMSVKCRGQD